MSGKAKPNVEPASRNSRDGWIVCALAVGASITAFVHYFLQNKILLYGDAVAHINIARRVFDSRSPGLDQLGTVWLPLPHLLTIPFIVNNWMWRTGVGGSIPSMVAYVVGVLGVFRLVGDSLREHPHGRLAAWIAALVYGANPNLLYMQATAMTESLSLAFFVWAVVFFAEFVRGVINPSSPPPPRRVKSVLAGGPGSGKGGAPNSVLAIKSAARSLWWCALMLSGEMLTRYDGWFVAFAVAAVLLAFLVTQKLAVGDDEKVPRADSGRRTASGVFIRFALLISIVPVFWFTYNYRLYGNPLEFATGPYSARAIAEHTARAGDPPYPGKDHPATAALYFAKSAVLNLAGSRLEGEYGHWWRQQWQDAWYLVLLAGTLPIVFGRRLAASGVRKGAAPSSINGKGASDWYLLLLWVPLPFYALSIAYGGVPIFIPSWWPYSYYNVRYGLQLLPVAAVCLAMIMAYGRSRRAVTAVALLFVAVTYIGSWRTDPICLREAFVNSRPREQLESKLAEALVKIPPGASILMSLGEHVGALERAGVPLKQTINENNYDAWRQAIERPAKLAEYAIAFDDDLVSNAIKQDGVFVPLQTIHGPGEASAVVYRRK